MIIRTLMYKSFGAIAILFIQIKPAPPSAGLISSEFAAGHAASLQ